MDKLMIKEYAKLRKVSMMALRSRIKAGTLYARLEHGRHLIVGQAGGRRPEQVDAQIEQADSQLESIPEMGGENLLGLM